MRVNKTNLASILVASFLSCSSFSAPTSKIPDLITHPVIQDSLATLCVNDSTNTSSFKDVVIKEESKNFEYEYRGKLFTGKELDNPNIFPYQDEKNIPQKWIKPFALAREIEVFQPGKDRIAIKVCWGIGAGYYLGLIDEKFNRKMKTSWESSHPLYLGRKIMNDTYQKLDWVACHFNIPNGSVFTFDKHTYLVLALEDGTQAVSKKILFPNNIMESEVYNPLEQTVMLNNAGSYPSLYQGPISHSYLVYVGFLAEHRLIDKKKGNGYHMSPFIKTPKNVSILITED